MTQIVEHRSALPSGPVVEVHVRHDPDAETPDSPWSASAHSARPPIQRHFRNHCRPPMPFFKHSRMQSESGLPAFGLMTLAVTSRRRNALCETRAGVGPNHRRVCDRQCDWATRRRKPEPRDFFDVALNRPANIARAGEPSNAVAPFKRAGSNEPARARR